MLSTMPRGYHEFYAVYGWVRINRISLVESKGLQNLVNGSSHFEGKLITSLSRLEIKRYGMVAKI